MERAVLGNLSNPNYAHGLFDFTVVDKAFKHVAAVKVTYQSRHQKVKVS